MKKGWEMKWIFAGLFCAFFAVPAQASPCTAHNGLVIANSLVRDAQDIRAGEALTLGGRPFGDLPAFCRVTATAGLDRHSNILVELWLPDLAVWNRKLLGTGNRGFAGS